MQIFNSMGEYFGPFEDKELLALRLTIIAKLAKQMLWQWECAGGGKCRPYILYEAEHAPSFCEITYIKYPRSREKPLRLIWKDYCFEVKLRWHHLEDIKVYIFEDMGLTLKEVEKAGISHETRTIIRANLHLDTHPDGSRASLWEEYLRLRFQSDLAHGFERSREDQRRSLPRENSVQPIPADPNAVLVQQAGMVLERQKSEEVKPIQWTPVENSLKPRFLFEG